MSTLTVGQRHASRSFEVWGLTGGIGAGKSEVARLLHEHGIPSLDADGLARELSAPGGAAHAALLKRFGNAERPFLRKKAFSDPEARRDLEAILHPLIRAESLKRLELLARGAPLSVRSQRPVVLYEAALLRETGRFKELDGLILVTAPVEARAQRVAARDGRTVQEIQAIQAAQAPDDEAPEGALVIVNDGDLATLRSRVAQVAGLLVGPAGA